MDFEDWLKHCFTQELAAIDTLDELGIEPMQLAPETSLDFVSRCFEGASEILPRFDDAHANQGLFYLVHPMHGDQASSMLDIEQPWEARHRCIRSVHALFTRYFAPRLKKTPKSALAEVCERFWEVFPTDGKPGQPAFKETDRELLVLLEEVLAIDEPTCVKSALRGASMWRSSYRAEVEAILDRYLEKKPPADLAKMAQDARRGTIPPAHL